VIVENSLLLAVDEERAKCLPDKNMTEGSAGDEVQVLIHGGGG